MYDVIVVGGGAAGLTAALYTSRQGMSTLVLTKDIGGQAILTPSIFQSSFHRVGYCNVVRTDWKTLLSSKE